MGLPELPDKRREENNKGEMEDTLIQAIVQETHGKIPAMNLPQWVEKPAHNNASLSRELV